MAYMSQQGYDKLVAELQHLESVERPAASAAIAEARDKGDLSENAEYDAAKEWQSKLETKIAMLKQTIHDAKIIDTKNLKSDEVGILCTVEIKNLANGMTAKYRIVSALLKNDFTITLRQYAGRDDDTGYHNYTIDVQKHYSYERTDS